MAAPPPHELIERVRALPAAAPLFARLGDEPRVHLVGGAVRDLLLGGEPVDLDLLVEGDAGEVARRLGDEVLVHDRFGTSTVVIDGRSYDIARARAETYARPGALPDITPAGLDEDLRRRDFTVNAMAIALGGPDAGVLTTAPAAIEDLDAHILRVLHERSFIDDPTRLLRLARYAARLGFAVEPRTRALAGAAVEGDALNTVTGPRLGTELRLAAREQDQIAAFSALRELGLDDAIHPGFGLLDAELLRRALALLPTEARRDLLTLAVAGLGVPTAELAALFDRLAFDARDRDVVLAAAGRADAAAAELAGARIPSQVAAALDGAPVELAALAGALGPEAPAREWLDRLRHVRLEIDGRDLIDAGVDEGPAIGRGLRAALDAKLDGRVSGREAELAEALEAAR